MKPVIDTLEQIVRALMYLLLDLINQKIRVTLAQVYSIKTQLFVYMEGYINDYI